MIARLLAVSQAVLTLIAFGLCGLWLRVSRDVLPLPYYALRFAIVIAMLGAVGVWIVRRLPGLRSISGGRAVFGLLALIYGLWAFASAGWAYMSTTRPEIAVSLALQMLIVGVFLVQVLALRPSPRAVIRVWAGVAVVIAAITMAQVAAQGSLGLTGLGEFAISAAADGASILRAGGLEYVRPYGLMPHPNPNAGFLVIGVLAWAALTLEARTVRGRLICAGGLALTTLAVLLSFSRAAWIGGAVGAALMLPGLWMIVRRRAAWPAVSLIGAGVAVTGVVFVLLYAPFVLARTGAGQESVELRSVADRLIFTDYAIRAFTEHPIGGVGAGNFPWKVSTYLQETFYELRGDNVHNVLLSAAADLGAVGAGLLIAVHGVGGVLAVRAVRRAREHDRAACCALFGAWAALIVIGLFDHYPYTFPQFHLAGWGALAVLAGQTGLRPPVDVTMPAAPSRDV